VSKNKLAGVIVACTMVIIAVIVLINLGTCERAYTLTVSVNPLQGGSVSPAGGEYESGAQVTLTASSASDYASDYWDGAASGSSNPRQHPRSRPGL